MQNRGSNLETSTLIHLKKCGILATKLIGRKFGKSSIKLFIFIKYISMRGTTGGNRVRQWILEGYYYIVVSGDLKMARI
jgi:hypothetical protein